MSNDLVGLAEIAQMLGVPRQSLDEICHSDQTFPPPDALIAAGHLWSRAAVAQWARDTGRVVGDLKGR